MITIICYSKFVLKNIPKPTVLLFQDSESPSTLKILLKRLDDVISSWKSKLSACSHKSSSSLESTLGTGMIRPTHPEIRGILCCLDIGTKNRCRRFYRTVKIGLVPIGVETTITGVKMKERNRTERITTTDSR